MTAFAKALWNKITPLRVTAVIMAYIGYLLTDRFFLMMEHMVSKFVEAGVDTSIWVGILIGAAITVGTGVIIGIIGVVNKLIEPEPGDPGTPTAVVLEQQKTIQALLVKVFEDKE